MFHIATHDSSDVVIDANQELTSMYLIVSGNFRTTDGTVNFGPGSIIGESALLAKRVTSSALMCEESGVVMSLTRSDFSNLCRRRPWLGVALLEKLGQRVAINSHEMAQGKQTERLPWL